MADRKQTFAPEVRAEAVRLAQTSGRSRREVAADLGVGLSTLRNWIDGWREREMDNPPADRQEDMAAELKRLHRENEVLRQEREILKRATAFFRQGGESMRFRLVAGWHGRRAMSGSSEINTPHAKAANVWTLIPQTFSELAIFEQGIREKITDLTCATTVFLVSAEVRSAPAARD